MYLPLKILLFTLVFTGFASFNVNGFQVEFIANFQNSPFPNELRSKGHSYNNVDYSQNTHYSSQESLILIPKSFKNNGTVHLFVYYHGWNNNIRKANDEFKIGNQFQESKANAIMLFPEGPVNAPDSFGGNHENKGVFEKYILEVLDTLKKRDLIRKDSELGNICLAGHSGGYRVIAKILSNKDFNTKIKEVYLFDGLYSFVDIYTDWAKNNNHRWINIYTKDGGTYDLSVSLNTLNWSKNEYIQIEENSLSKKILKRYNLINIYSDLSHNEVINARNQLLHYLNTSDDLH